MDWLPLAPKMMCASERWKSIGISLWISNFGVGFVGALPCHFRLSVRSGLNMAAKENPGVAAMREGHSMTDPARCRWGGAGFSPRHSGGSVQKFCSSSCRQQFHTAARQWVSAAVDDGRLTVADLKATTAPCTLRRGAMKGSRVLDPQKAAL